MWTEEGKGGWERLRRWKVFRVNGFAWIVEGEDCFASAIPR